MLARVLSGLVAAALVAGLAAPGGADEDDAAEARQRVRDQQAAVIAELDVLQAQDAEIEAALATLEANVAAEEALLAEAEAAAEEAERALQRATADVRRTEREIERLERDLEQLAVAAYIGAGSTEPAVLLLSSDDGSELARRSGFVDVVSTDIDTVVDRLERTRERLERQREDAEDAADAAADRRAEAEERLATVVEARDVQAAFAAEVDARIEARLAEAAALATLDAELSAEIERQQAALAAQALAAGGGGGAAGGRSVSYVDPAELRTVRGITVHQSIAPQLEAMLAAAEADGIILGGGGFRSPASQIRLRQQHCPDVWTSPASACTPPTARPGTSLHERGLAIDFTHEGRAIPTRDNPAFQWLAANAERFGFYNLPSEPWHWSTTGG